VTASASLALARRALRNSFRRPQFLAPLVIFPTMFLAVNVGGLGETQRLPGFPTTDGFLDFQLAAAMTQSLLLGGVMSGIAVALEIEGGFFDRLVAAPIPRLAIVLGRMVATAVLSALQVTWFLALGYVFGADLDAGPVGVLVLSLIAIVAGVGCGAIGQALAYRARNASTVQGIFPLVFVILFVSSAFFPRELLDPPASWVADYNPLSYIADGMRNPLIDSLDWTVALEGLAAAALVLGVAGAIAIATLRGRLREA
jgi:ABC-2 type transport system permease protein